MFAVNRIVRQLFPRPIIEGTNSFATFSKRKVIGDERSQAQKFKDPAKLYEEDIKNYLTTTTNLSDLKEFKQGLFQKYKNNIQLNEHSFDGLFMRFCLAARNLDMGKAYIHMLQDSGQKVNTATLSKYILLCAFCSDQIKDNGEIERLCTELRAHSQYLNAASLESIIVGLSLTEKWEEGLKLLTDHEEAQTALSLNAYISKFVALDDFNSALIWIECAMKKDRPIYEPTYEQWIKKCSLNEEAWQTLSDFLGRHQVFLPQTLAETLKDALEKKIANSFVGKFTSIDKRTGLCRSCRKTMKSASITSEQFQALKKNMLEKVLCGVDVYKGSTPEELRKFYSFIERNAPYDVVVDGLNVAYFAANGNNRAANLKKIEAVRDS